MRALSQNPRRATAVTLAAALLIAVYLNWQYARTGSIETEETALWSREKAGAAPV